MARFRFADGPLAKRAKADRSFAAVFMVLDTILLNRDFHGRVVCAVATLQNEIGAVHM